MADRSTDLLIPAILHGAEKEVRDRVRRLLYSVWTLDEWQSGLAALEMVPIHDASDLIMIYADKGCSRPTELFWRPYLLHGWPRACGMTDANTLRWRRLMLEGMDQWWFTLMMLCNNDMPWISDESTNELRDNLVLPMLQHFVRWMPTVLTLWDRYMVNWYVKYAANSSSPHLQQFWRFGNSVYRAGYEVDVNRLDHLIDTWYEGDAMACLVGERIAIRSAEGYQLCPPSGFDARE